MWITIVFIMLAVFVIGLVIALYLTRESVTTVVQDPEITLYNAEWGSSTEWLDQLQSKPKAVTKKQKIYDCLAQNPQGLTCEEIEEKTGLAHTSVTARILDLKQDGQVRQKGTRTNKTGRKARVWVTNGR
jgi:hypothetical protein